MTSRPIAYRRRPSPLHATRAAVGAAYGAALATAALIVDHPLVLGALLVAVCAAGVAAGLAGELRRVARGATLLLVGLPVLVNALVSRQGLTVLARLGDWGPLGQQRITLEAVVYGLVMGLRLLVVTLAAVLVVCAVDPDEALRACRRVSHRSALTAAITARLVPVLHADARRLAEAQRCRADAAATTTRTRLTILHATVIGSLDRALDVAASLEMRGYGASRHPSAIRRPWSRHDVAFLASSCAVLTVAIATTTSGRARFTTYPLIHAAPLGAAVAVSLLLIAIALAPFLDRRGIDP